MRRLLILTLVLVGAVRAADPPPAPPTDTELQKAKQQAAFEQERLRRQFGDFQRSLLTLAQRYEKSAKAEDREKALVLRQAIELATREGIDNQFNKLVAALTSSGITLQEINSAIGQNEQLSRNLREMIAILLSDSQSAKLKEEQRRLAELLKMLDAVLRAQKIERSKTEAGKLDGEQLAKSQAKVTSDTKKLSDAMGKDKKAGDPKDSKGQPKDGKGQPKDGQPKDGQPKDGQPKDGQPKDGQPKDGQPKDGDKKDQPPSEDPPGREQVKDAIENQNNAEKNLKKNDKEKASNEQDEAIKKLEEVRKEIERRLKQMREEEQEKLLNNLEVRLKEMLGAQIQAYDDTKRLHSTIQANPEQKASRNEDLKAGDLSGREGQIVIMANKALQLLEEDGTAVAVPQVLEQARDDMKKVQALLFKTEVGPFCQGIEEDIIASLKEIIEALKKAQQELKDRKDQPPPPQGQQPPSPLINALAELRMLRNLQVKVNRRTIDYGKQYTGEQADDGKIQDELRSLAERQVKIQKATKDIATGRAGGNQ